MVLFYGITLFLTAFLIHLLIWRIHTPGNHTKFLLGVFTATFACGVLVIRHFEPYEYLRLFILYGALALAYIVTYSAIEVDSPSLLILMAIGKNAKEGLGIKTLNEIMTDEILVKPRVADLLNGGIAYMDKDRYVLTPRGVRLARLFIFYRRLMNMGMGG